MVFPIPKKINMFDGSFKINKNGYIFIDDRKLYSVLKAACKAPFSAMEIAAVQYINRAPDIVVKRNDVLDAEGYKISVSESNISVEYGSLAGAFYAFITLNQLAEGKNAVPLAEIEDYPDLKIRGYMLDIARGKIPKLSTILEIVDRLASLKYNHFELYIEGAPFAYPSFPEMWENKSVITGDELMAIDEYCKQRFIDFVPNHNTFGHMTEWLRKLPDEMKICPNGFYYEPWDMQFPYATSINPLDERSFELVRRISDDLLPNFTSDKFNVDCDEVLELGQGVTEGYTEEQLVKFLYDHFMKLYAYCNEKGKTMLYWADMVLQHPEIIPKMPKDAIALNWGYEPYEPTEESCALCEKGGIPYCVCPGTGTWSTYTGKTGQMFGNIKNAIQNGLRHSCCGVLLTDWGDGCHAQGYATNIPGITYNGGLSWNFEDNKDVNLGEVTDFLLGTDGFGQFMLDVGYWHAKERLSLKNQTITGNMMFCDFDNVEFREIPSLTDCINHNLLDEITADLDDCLERLNHLDLSPIADSNAIYLEYRAGINAVKIGQLCGHYKLYLLEKNDEGRKKVLEKIIELVPSVIHDFEVSWTVKNKRSSLQALLGFFVEKKAGAEKILNSIGKG